MALSAPSGQADPARSAHAVWLIGKVGRARSTRSRSRRSSTTSPACGLSRPSNAEDARRALIEALEVGDPVIFLEHRALYDADPGIDREFLGEGPTGSPRARRPCRPGRARPHDRGVGRHAADMPPRHSSSCQPRRERGAHRSRVGQAVQLRHSSDVPCRKRDGCSWLMRGHELEALRPRSSCGRWRRSVARCGASAVSRFQMSTIPRSPPGGDARAVSRPSRRGGTNVGCGRGEGVGPFVAGDGHVRALLDIDKAFARTPARHRS